MLNLIYSFVVTNLYLITLHIKQYNLFNKPKYSLHCHKIIPFVRPFKLTILNFYSTTSSYLYHQDMYVALKYGNEIRETPQQMVHSIVNSIVSISSIEPCYYKYSIPIHLCKIFNLDDAIPIGLDTLFYFSTDAIIIYYIYILVKFIEPFHNMNPLALHILLIILRNYSSI